MAFRATLSVVLGCNFGSAARLLAAAEAGQEQVVAQVLGDKPQLAAFSGFHGTTSPLHRAAAAGHLGVCRAIVEPLKARIRAAEAAAGGPGSTRAAAAGSKWRRLLATVLNQRSHKSLTPLMLACEHGHATVAAYLLREGADPLASDFVHSRTCLHYAAVGGHADCLRLLCSDAAMVPCPEGARPLRDVIVSDLQVQACRFIDQRAFGGLTALHFAVVTGNLDAVQALLRAGASIMVKSDGEAYIGEDYLVPGSTPLHVAVIINNISIVHAILQAHMEMMNIMGTTLDERGRRPWEGTSRTDIRSVRNHFRKLPFHLARERHQPQLMSLVDPRIPIDVALDAARDTEHGIGPKRLGTICSLVLQRSLLQWLDDCQRELAREAAAKQLAAVVGAQQQAAAGASQRPSTEMLLPMSPARPSPDATSPPATTGASLGGDAAACPSIPEAAAVAQQAGLAEVQETAQPASPFAPLAGVPPSLSPRVSPVPRHRPSASAPATPADTRSGALAAVVVPASEGAVLGLAAAAPAGGQPADGEGPSDSSMQRMASLHGYMGLLSLKRPQSARSLDALRGMQAASGRPSGAGTRAMARQLSGSVTPLARSSSSSGPAAAAGTAQSARVRFLTDPSGLEAQAAAAALDAADAGSPASSPRGDVAALGAEGTGADRIISVVVPQHRRTSSQGNVRLGSMFGSLRERLRSSEALSPEAAGLVSRGPSASARAAAAAGGGPLLGEKHSEKDLALDSEPEPCSPTSESEAEEEDEECGVCLDAVVEVAFAACQHKLCLECARNLTRQDKKPPHCPFCRRLVVGFQRVSATGAHHGGSHSSRCTSPTGQHISRAHHHFAVVA